MANFSAGITGSTGKNKRKAEGMNGKGGNFSDKKKSKTFKPSGNNNKNNNNNNSKPAVKTTIDPNMSSSAQRRALKHERQSHRRHADVVKDAKDLWNQLRLKTNTKQEIVPIMDKLMVLLYHTDTTLCEIALQHDASRVVQAAIQFANDDQRRQLCRTLQAQLPEMAKIQYAHFCVLKLIQYGHKDPECVKLIVKSFKGHVCKMAVHAVGARVVELLFSTLPAKHTHVLRQEFYGPHFSLFSDVVVATNSPKTTPTLQSNIELHPDKKEAACDFVNNLLQKGLDKGLYGFAFFQQLLSEYIAVIGHDKDLISNLVDHSLHMLSTRPGTQVVIYCTAFGTAKDRKRILKAVKGYTRSSLLHRDAYLAILQIVLVTDDTVSVHKSLLAELLTVDPDKKESEVNQNHPLLEIALHDQASKLLLLLVAPSDSDNVANDDKDDKGVTRTSTTANYNKFLDPLEQALLQRNPMVMEPSSGVEVPTCKKNASTRRKELLQYMIKPLEQLCLQHTDQLARSLAGSRVLQQVYMNVSSSDELREKLVQLCCPTSASKNDETGQSSLLDDPVGHYLAKHLVAANHDFAHSLAKAVDFDTMMSSSRAAFVVVALCKTPERETVLQRIPKSKLLAAMERLKSKDDDADDKKVATMAGFEALLKEVNGGK